jgi:peptidoglycan/LPS O-acetylase OafA/YrhL
LKWAAPSFACVTNTFVFVHFLAVSASRLLCRAVEYSLDRILPGRNLVETAHQLGDLGKLQSVELIRFLAAFSVILWHYQFYFFFSKRGDLPFSQFLTIFYNSGLYAVMWFWVLSGYVFFFNYRDTLIKNTVTGFEFFSNRFARLYPLHLATLLAVSLLLLSYNMLFGSEYPLYTEGVTFQTFLAHLFMASNWVSTAYTLNGPIWSVSVEVLIYFLFFFLTKYGRVTGVSKVMLIVAICSTSYYIATRRISGTPIWIAECATCFYLGGLVYEIHRRYTLDIFEGVRQALFWTVLAAILVAFYWFRPVYVFTFFLPASVILFIVSTDAIERSRIIAKVARVGNWTYSSYLLHFPIALLIVIGARLVGLDIFTIAERPIFLIAYCVSVFVLADFCYTFFETPARRALRAIAKRNVQIGGPHFGSKQSTTSR